MRNYIITGASGHLATNIIEILQKEKCNIYTLLLKNEKKIEGENIFNYWGDVVDVGSLTPLFENAKSNDTVVIHTAGIISIANKPNQKLYDVNVLGTKNIVEMCIKYKVKRLLYVSSVHAIRELPKGETIEEIKDFDERTVVGGYAKTKAMATKIVFEGIKRGLDGVIVHPSGIMGVGNSNNHLNQLVYDYLNGNLPAIVKGGYDFVDVKDVAKGCLLAIEKGKCGENYILSGEYLTIGKLFEYIKEESGGKRKVALPIWMAKMVAPLFELISKIRGTRPLFTRYALYTLKSNALFSHKKATQELGYTPKSMKECVKDMINYYKRGKVPLNT